MTVFMARSFPGYAGSEVAKLRCMKSNTPVLLLNQDRGITNRKETDCYSFSPSTPTASLNSRRSNSDDLR